VRLDGSGLKRLTTSRAADNFPAWAPNGGTIAYTREVYSPSLGRWTVALWAMDPDGRHKRLLLGNAGPATWSPGGNWIAFVRDNRLWVAHRDGSHARLMAELSLAGAVWSPDSHWLVTWSDERTDLILVRTDGSSAYSLTNEPGLFHAWASWQRLPLKGSRERGE